MYIYIVHWGIEYIIKTPVLSILNNKVKTVHIRYIYLLFKWLAFLQSNKFASKEKKFRLYSSTDEI